ncbi:type II toxin-antitoxin system HicB family antitoxin [Sphingomonas sp. TREG-RG-20F-R18-01]|uniref:type II toxin-antitoxin system HicB family antitoxin n=1 Tax=Sphingomonas sp. TREG-RG-20F-R18-01 TaxID=2914982 RepID=UPI001F57805F|nr:type II toxin-antitoxin system HicB family antitoxin [Sphingomonas sp. TREG-RG-20F-R18-01]
MKYFYAVVHQDEDSAFGVTFPDLPGCFSASDDMAQLLPNACDALELWFEDAKEVKPLRLDQVQSYAADELRQGAFILAVPFIRNTGKLARVNLSLDHGMLDAIDKAANARSLTRSAFMAQAARNEIECRR